MTAAAKTGMNVERLILRSVFPLTFPVETSLYLITIPAVIVDSTITVVNINIIYISLPPKNEFLFYPHFQIGINTPG
jgi:hypothetical protein